MGQLVDQGHGRGALQDGVDVHLGEDGAAVVDLAAPDLLQAVQQHLGARPGVVLHEGHHAVGAALDPAVRLESIAYVLPTPGAAPR